MKHVLGFLDTSDGYQIYLINAQSRLFKKTSRAVLELPRMPKQSEAA